MKHSRDAHFKLLPDAADIAIAHEFETTPESIIVLRTQISD